MRIEREVSKYSRPIIYYTPNAVVEWRQYFCQDHAVRSVIIYMCEIIQLRRIDYCYDCIDLLTSCVVSQVPRMLVTWAVHRPIVVEYYT